MQIDIEKKKESEEIMQIYIEKEFLDDFFIEFDNNPTKGIVKNLITKYPDKTVFINFDIDCPEKLEEYKKENSFFAEIKDNGFGCKATDNILESVRDSKFYQTLVFTKNAEIWHKEMEDKGAWCFNYDNYLSEIEKLINKIHFKIDLSKSFNNWAEINFSNIPFNHLQIADGYILKPESKISKNLIPLIETFIKGKNEKVKIDILFKEMVSKEEKEKNGKVKIDILSREHAQKIHRKLNLKFSNKINLNFYSSKQTKKIDFHDRTIITNFSITDSGIGFSLMDRNISNSQIISESIFDEYTYERLKRLRKLQQNYIRKLNNEKEFQSIYFYKYP